MSVKRIGVLTSGGDAPGMNAVVRAIAMGADGIVNLKIAKITTEYSVRYEATGLCIKRK